jgi:hypothetical protein
MRIKLFFFCFLVFLMGMTCGMGTVALGQTNPLEKRILIKSAQNDKPDIRFQHLQFPENCKNNDLTLLNEYVLGQVDFTQYQEPELFFKALEWVSLQWQHDGFNQPHDSLSSYEILQNVRNGERYRCVEYGKVVSDLLLSMGYVSRQIGMQSKDVAYGGFGMGHVASEVWSDQLQKWVFIDPQFSIYAKYKGKVLSFYDIYLLKQAGKFDKIDFITSSAYLKASGAEPKSHAENYRGFLRSYFGAMVTGYKIGEKNFQMVLLLEKQDPYMTFQGFPMDNLLFTSDPFDVYVPLNNANMVFAYNIPQDFMVKAMEVFASGEIDSDDKFLALRQSKGITAVPDFTLKLNHNMPWFSYFEVKADGQEWKRVDGDTYAISLEEGTYTILVRAVNQAGHKGKPAKVEVYYGK